MAWSLAFDACTSCGTTERPHRAKGLCRRCYGAQPDVAARHAAAHQRRTCTPEYRARQRAQYRAKPEARKAAARRWNSEHRAKSGEELYRRPAVYWRNRHELIHVRGECCAWCGADRNLEAHHIVHEADGGGHEIENLMILCADHHRGPLGIHAQARRTALAA